MYPRPPDSALSMLDETHVALSYHSILVADARDPFRLSVGSSPARILTAGLRIATAVLLPQLVLKYVGCRMSLKACVLPSALSHHWPFK